LSDLYRKKAKYTKSIYQYKRERARRKQVWQLWNEGFSQKQIAEKLGVSEKTVGRDWRKLLSYRSKLQAWFNEAMNQALSKRIHELPPTIGLSLCSSLIICKDEPAKDKMLMLLLSGRGLEAAMLGKRASKKVLE
jgi:transcriptional regulator with XRE-family HTH domain